MKFTLAIICFLALSAPALAEPRAPLDCMPIPALSEMLKKMPGYTHLRAVEAGRTEEALAIFSALKRREPMGHWTIAFLLDGPRDTGLLLVGKIDSVCEYAALDAEDYGRLVRRLEGQAI